jgi:lipid-binding SYLF domain-containing protein
VHTIKQHILFSLTLVLALFVRPVGAQWEADASDEQQLKAAKAVEKIRSEIPRTEHFFDKAYGYAILPSVTRIGIGFGGATGKGFVIEGDKAIGKTRFWQFTSGIQAGFKNFSMILFFKDKEALDKFTQSKVQFLGQAGLSVGTFGVAGTPSYSDGVAIVTMNRFGLIGEFSYSGARFSYEALTGTK